MKHNLKIYNFYRFKLFSNSMIKIIIFFLLYITLSAHPHEFAEVKVKLDFKEDNILDNIEIIWEFDEMASLMILSVFDKNSDNKLDNKEIDNLEKNGFNNLKELNYYTNINFNGKNIEVNSYTYFDAYVKNNKVCFKYQIIEPLFKQEFKELRLFVNDPEYYTAFNLKLDNIFFAKSENFNMKIQEIEKDFYLIKELSIVLK